MTAKTVCFTGHRHLSRVEEVRLEAELAKEIESRIQSGACVFRTGGAIGFDTLAACGVLRAKEAHPHIRLELILPCPEQTRDWQTPQRALYERILQEADSYRYVSPFYFAGVMQQRNRALVTGADVCIGFLRSSQGGGAYTASYALRMGLEFINLCDRLR